MGYLYQSSYETLCKVNNLDDLKRELSGHSHYKEMLNDVGDGEDGSSFEEKLSEANVKKFTNSFDM